MSEHKVDVICQCTREGKVIPLKIRVIGEDQEYKCYMIRSSRDITSETVELPNEVIVTSNIMRFACEIEVFGISRKITLLYNKSKTFWTMYI